PSARSNHPATFKKSEENAEMPKSESTLVPAYARPSPTATTPMLCRMLLRKFTIIVATDLPLSLQKCCSRCFDHCPKIWSASENVSSSGDSKTASFVERQITFVKRLHVTGQAIRVRSREHWFEELSSILFWL